MYSFRIPGFKRPWLQNNHLFDIYYGLGEGKVEKNLVLLASSIVLALFVVERARFFLKIYLINLKQ